ncbi:LytR C-terminal domain-containing protein [Gordonia aichiensis]|uniref:LytR C-terminal domain-containing protein n=1 Tax=Gordonia aichiensis TaxID=36820 RepID=UPI0032673499
MNADRETNRLPLRAGAMLLLAIAVVCLGLGIHQLTMSDEAPDAGLKAAGESAQAAASAERSQQEAPSSTPAQTSARTADTAGVPKLCVLNAGNVTGLAGEVSKTLTDAGFKVGETANLSTGSISENTIFFNPDQEEAAKKVAAAVPGGADLAARPAVFTRCADELAVIVVSR